ncbi:MAG: DUF502 domain-containing protein [Chloroflexi bacterium]|nr:DUF502 domain-containing protein [Chloroflexota bacterium]
MTERPDSELEPAEESQDGRGRRMRNGLTLHLRGMLITGTLLLVPVALTYLVFLFIYDVVNGVLEPGIERIFAEIGREDWSFPGIGVVAAVILIYLAGVLAAGSIGVKLIRWMQRAAVRVPMIGTVYSASRQLIESFSGGKETGFQRVVMIQYPRRGYWAMGFLTSIIDSDAEGPLAVVYIPTAPLPNSGWLAVVPFDEVYDTEITPQTAMRFVFSGGIVSPKAVKMTKAPEASKTKEPLPPADTE